MLAALLAQHGRCNFASTLATPNQLNRPFSHAYVCLTDWLISISHHWSVRSCQSQSETHPLASDSSASIPAGLFPEFGTLEAFAGQLLMDDFGTLLSKFAEDARLEGTYFLCRQDSVMRAARLLSRVEGLSLQVGAGLSSARVLGKPWASTLR